MARESIADLIAKLYNGKVDRRDFLKRSAAAGLSAALAGQVVARYDRVSAQDSTMPESTKIGLPGATHVTDTSKGTIKLYSSWPLTGSMETIGGDAVEAFKMGLADFGNAAGGFAIEYEALDDGVAANNGGWEAGKETENVNKVINDENAVIYLATYNSGAAKISIPITGAAGMAQLSYANTYPGLTKAVPEVTEEGEPDIYYPSGKRNYMRVCPADDTQGAAQALWAYNEMGKRKAYILHDKSLYGQGVALLFKVFFEKLGGETLGFEGYDKDLGDYQSVMASIADKEPDTFYLGATVENNAAKVLQDMRSVMAPEDVIFIGPDGLISTAFVEGAGDAAEGAYLTFAGYSADKLLELGGPGADYVTRVTELLGHSPDAYAVYAYETLVLVMQTIDKVGEKDRTKILDTMFATEGFVSLLGGSWSFTETGDTDSTVIGLDQVIDGQITFQKLLPIS